MSAPPICAVPQRVPSIRARIGSSVPNQSVQLLFACPQPRHRSTSPKKLIETPRLAITPDLLGAWCCISPSAQQRCLHMRAYDIAQGTPAHCLRKAIVLLFCESSTGATCIAEREESFSMRMCRGILRAGGVADRTCRADLQLCERHLRSTISPSP